MRAAFGRWLLEGARTALFLKPRWQGLPASPWWVAVLVFSATLLTVAIERSYFAGPAAFNWQAIAGGWLATALIAWACFVASRHEGTHLLCMMLAQGQVIGLVFGLIWGTLMQTGTPASALGAWAPWILWIAPGAWITLAQLVLLWRSGLRGGAPWLAAATALVLATVVLYAVPPDEYWQAAETAEDAPAFELTQEAMEDQPVLLTQRLDDLAPQRRGLIDLYAITFAPFAGEDVFRRESAMVADVMAARFDASGRTLQLVNNPLTVEQWPWATPLNLQRAISAIADVMDPDEDVLFIHLTSHGAADGELAAEFPPMSVAPVTPEDLKAWLDEAGIRHRIISISACYSGSWIAPLAGDDTLVMTAADADHTSFGCGRGSELTFFGRAMYDEQLRNATRSFEQAHAASRELIREREKAAGKDDGYSNPQIKVGASIRPLLARLQERLEGPGAARGDRRGGA